MVLRQARHLCALILVAVIGLAGRPGIAEVWLEPSYPNRPLRGAEAAEGAVVWSHGRSFDGKDAEAPTPPYLAALRDAGWDVFRFNRTFEDDALSASADALVTFVEGLEDRGYDRVALAGQSFGAFVSLIAAGRSDDIESVVATAPAAYGSFYDSYDTWRNNAEKLYPLLRAADGTRIMLFFFHGDEYDPGGRAEESRAILADGDGMVIDQPADLPGHGAAATGLFARRFADCILRFVGQQAPVDETNCEAPWGRMPSARLSADSLYHPAALGAGATASMPVAGSWYGFYANGREILLTIDGIEGDVVTATYRLGPGLTPDQPAERDRRRGRIVDGELIFDENGKNILRFRLRPNGALAATWRSRTGTARLETVLHRLP